MPRRVAVTGVGVVSALGNGREAFWEGLAAGRSGLAPLTLVKPEDFRFRLAGEAAGFRYEGPDETLLDRFAQFAVTAGREALADSGLDPAPELRRDGAIVLGSCLGGQGSMDDSFLEVYKHGAPRVHPFTIPRVMANAGASALSMQLGLQGPAWTVSTACSSSTHAIGQAFAMVQSGQAPWALAGGSEAPLSFGLLKAWEAMRVVSPDTCRPFSRDRKGLVLGEGAAVLVLEPLEAALARGARVYAELAGFGMSSDAHHITQPSADGAALAMERALAGAGCARERVGYVNAHGTGTSANDATETAALRQVFGPHAEKLAVSSTKSMHGHALGAAGALEAAAAVLALQRGVLPPTANYTEPDPACDLDVIPNEARAARVDAALSNSFAFGGLNAVLLFYNASALP